MGGNKAFNYALANNKKEEDFSSSWYTRRGSELRVHVSRMRVQRYGLFLIPPNIFGTFFQKMLFVVMLASDDKHENMVKIKTEVLDSC